MGINAWILLSQQAVRQICVFLSVRVSQRRKSVWKSRKAALFVYKRTGTRYFWIWQLLDFTMNEVNRKIPAQSQHVSIKVHTRTTHAHACTRTRHAPAIHRNPLHKPSAGKLCFDHLRAFEWGVARLPFLQENPAKISMTFLNFCFSSTEIEI